MTRTRLQELSKRTLGMESCMVDSGESSDQVGGTFDLERHTMSVTATQLCQPWHKSNYRLYVNENVFL